MIKKKHPNIDRATGKVPVLENKIHIAIADYLNLVIKRPSRWHTVEVSNQQKGRAGMFKQMALKRRGVKTGWPDIEIFLHSGYKNSAMFYIIFLEVKAPGGELTEVQERLHQELKEDGHQVHVVYGVEEVEQILKGLL